MLPETGKKKPSRVAPMASVYNRAERFFPSMDRCSNTGDSTMNVVIGQVVGGDRRNPEIPAKAKGFLARYFRSDSISWT